MASRTTTSKADAFRAWDERLESACTELHTPGLNAAALVGDEVVWTHAAGFARVESHEPLTPEHCHRIGSITKLFTAHVVLQLRDAGLLELDDPVVRYVPELRSAGADRITVRNILCHGGGIPTNAGLNVWQTGEFPGNDEFRSLLVDLTPVMPPMRDAKYSNAAYSILGLLISALDHTTYEHAVERRLLTPLGMDRTAFFLDGRAGAPFAPGHVSEPYCSDYVEAPHQDLRSWNACGMLLSTPTDLLKLARHQWAGSDLLPAETRDEMHTLQLMDSYEGAWRTGYGLGWRLARDGERVFAGHGGGYVGNRCQLALSLPDHAAVAVFANGNHATGIPELAHELLARLVAGHRVPTVDPDRMPERLQPVLGRYFARYWHGAEVRWRGGLELLDEDAGARPITLVQLDDQRFRITAGRDMGEDLEILEQTTNGPVERVRIAGMVYERA